MSDDIKNPAPKKPSITIKTDSSLKRIAAKKWFIITACSISVVVIFAFMLSSEKPKKSPSKKQATVVEIIPQDLKKQSWESNAQRKIETILRKLSEQESKVSKLEDVVKYQDQQLESKDSEIARLGNRLSAQEERVGGITRDISSTAKPSTSKNTGLPPVPDLFEDVLKETPQPKVTITAPPKQNGDDSSEVGIAPPPIPTEGFALTRNEKTTKRSVVHVPEGDVIGKKDRTVDAIDAKRRLFSPPPVSSSSAETDASLVGAEYVENKFAGYLPPHTSAQIVTLSGLEALASAHARSNPEPIFVRIQTNGLISSMGNSTSKYWTQGCTVAVMAYGDLSASRVKGRLTKLVCHDKQNKRVIDEDIKGVLLDSDGALGLKGEVIRRNGSLIAATVLAEFVSAMGSAFAQPGLADFNAASNGDNGLGGFDTKAAVTASAFAGVSGGADKIAEYLLEEAKAIFPVIVVPNGRKGTIVLEEGISLKWNNMDGLYSKKVKPMTVAKQ